MSATRHATDQPTSRKQPRTVAGTAPPLGHFRRGEIHPEPTPSFVAAQRRRRTTI